MNENESVSFFLRFLEDRHKDYKQAFYWYKKAAEQGDAFAQNNLGHMFQNAIGTEQDYNKALFCGFQASGILRNHRF